MPKKEELPTNPYKLFLEKTAPISVPVPFDNK